MTENELPDAQAVEPPAPRRKQVQHKREKRDVHGWIILDKPVGMTSTHAVAVAKRLFSARRVNLKFAPDIRFRFDERFDEAERIEKILRTPEVRRDLESKPADEGE